MAVPTNGPQEYQHPRWLLHTATYGFASVCFCGLLVANIFPCMEGWPSQRYGQPHGWPFVYMVRESRVPGDLSVYYGPWPLDHPPLVWFRPMLLFVNVLYGSVLTFAAMVIPKYWLRTHRKPLRFNLRTLLWLITVVACLLGILKFYDPNLSLLGLFVLLPAILLAMFSVYMVPGGLMIVAAHWAVVRSANSKRRRKWFGIHWLAWLAVVAVGGPLLHYSLFAFTHYVYGPSETPGFLTMLDAYGWPLEYMSAVPDSPKTVFFLASEGLPTSCFHPLPLIADILILFALILSTGFVVDRWIRRVEQGIQMQPRTILAVVIVVCALIWILNNDNSFRPRWYDYPSWLLGIAGMIYAIQILVVRGVAWAVKGFCR